MEKLIWHYEGYDEPCEACGDYGDGSITAHYTSGERKLRVNGSWGCYSTIRETFTGDEAEEIWNTLRGIDDFCEALLAIPTTPN